MKKLISIFLLISIFSIIELKSNDNNSLKANYEFENSGLRFVSNDSSKSVNIQFRIQNQFVYNTVSEDDLSAASNEFSIRRLRLMLKGDIFKDFTYAVQLGFARKDIDVVDTDISKIILDAIIYWNISKNAKIGFGQTKLPGNRQYMNSVSELQFTEFSIVNSKFSLDRDFGFHGVYSNSFFDIPIYLRAAITSGDGRYAAQSKEFNLAYTARFEVLPFGKFEKNGDFSESDFVREQSPKLSLALAYSHNEKAERMRGTLGSYLLTPKDQDVIIADGIFKYKGFAMYGEYATRNCEKPYTGLLDGVPIYVYIGTGYLIQASYFLSKKFEIAARYAKVIPDNKIEQYKGADMNQNITTCFNYYFYDKNVKTQFEITHNTLENLTNHNKKINWIGRLNFELGL